MTYSMETNKKVQDQLTRTYLSRVRAFNPPNRTTNPSSVMFSAISSCGISK
jgi:hypothetical protein